MGRVINYRINLQKAVVHTPYFDILQSTTAVFLEELLHVTRSSGLYIEGQCGRVSGRCPRLGTTLTRIVL